jgi:CheY-like chemotaxis protein
LWTIVIAEDEPSFRNVLAAYLRDKGYHVLTARNGEEALDLLRRERVDLAVLDLMMPNLGGGDVIAAVRADPKLAVLPLVVLTATRLTPVEEALRPLVQEWLLKTTVSLAQVLETIRRHLPPPTALGGVPTPEPPKA